MTDKAITGDKYSYLKRCINCGIGTPYTKNSNMQLLPPKCREILKHWIGSDRFEEENATSESSSDTMPIDHKLCRECHNILCNYSDHTENEIPERVFGHTNVCIGCGFSQTKADRKPKPLNTEQMPYWSKLWPWHIHTEIKLCCRKCYRRLERFIEKVNNTSIDTYPILKANSCNTVPESVTRPTVFTETFQRIVKSLENPKVIPDLKQIKLSDGKRVPFTKKCCFFKHCKRTITKRIPKHTQRLLATCYDVYVSNGTRSCDYHDIHVESELGINKIFHNFTVPNFETYVDEIKEGIVVIDFENVESMPDHICEYWTGVNVNRFIEMYEELNRPKLMKSALATYLIRKITGDSIEKLAKLFNISSFTLKKQVKIVETCFMKTQ